MSQFIVFEMESCVGREREREFAEWHEILDCASVNNKTYTLVVGILVYI